MTNVPIADLASAGSATAPRDKRRTVAKYQRWVLVSLLASIFVVILLFAQAFKLFSIPDNARWLLLVVNWGLTIFMLISIVLLARQFYGVFATVLFAFAMFLPLISLIALLIVNGKSTKYLQQHGVKVGLLGADPNSI
jgi:hypothetical protein